MSRHLRLLLMRLWRDARRRRGSPVTGREAVQRRERVLSGEESGAWSACLEGCFHTGFYDHFASEHEYDVAPEPAVVIPGFLVGLEPHKSMLRCVESVASCLVPSFLALICRTETNPGDTSKKKPLLSLLSRPGAPSCPPPCSSLPCPCHGKEQLLAFCLPSPCVPLHCLHCPLFSVRVCAHIALYRKSAAAATATVVAAHCVHVEVALALHRTACPTVRPSRIDAQWCWGQCGEAANAFAPKRDDQGTPSRPCLVARAAL